MLGDGRLEMFLVAQHGQLLDQFSLRGVEPGRRRDVEVDMQIPATGALQSRRAEPRRVCTLPLWVPALTSIFCSPSRVSSGITVPSAAAVIGMLSCTCRSWPCRSNTGCGF